VGVENLYWHRKKIAIIAKYSRGFRDKPSMDTVAEMECLAKEALRKKLASFPELQVVEIVWGE